MSRNREQDREYKRRTRELRREGFPFPIVIWPHQGLIDGLEAEGELAPEECQDPRKVAAAIAARSPGIFATLDLDEDDASAWGFEGDGENPNQLWTALGAQIFEDSPNAQRPEAQLREGPPVAGCHGSSLENVA
jgi:hypothetical protein